MKLSPKIPSIFMVLVLLSIPILILSLTSCTPSKRAENKIIIWHWMNDRKDAFRELAEKYQAESGIDVEFKLFSPPDIYGQKVIAAARAGRLPDIFGILGEKKTLASFIKAGHILDLTPAMRAEGRVWEISFYPQALAVSRFKKANTYDVEPGIYAVPIDMTLMEFLYNKTLFKAAGYDPDIPPDSFTEFLEYAKKIKKELGVDGFVCGWGEGWLLNALATEWAINIMGERKFTKTLTGQVPYTDKQWVEVFSLFKKIKDSGILASDITTMINKEAEDLFSKGKVAFAFNGSWAVNIYRQLSADLDYAFFPLPKASTRPIKIWGGAGSSFLVSAKSPQREEAVKFLKWLTAKSQQEFLVAKTNNLPAIRKCEEALSPTLKTLVDDFNILTHPNIWPKNEDSRVLEVMNKGLQQIVMGIKEPAELAQEIQKVKESVCAQ